MASVTGTVVEQMSRDPKFQGLNAATTVTVIDKVVKKAYQISTQDS